MSKINESTIARIAGNLLSGRKPSQAARLSYDDEDAVAWAVEMARAIADQVERASHGRVN